MNHIIENIIKYANTSVYVVFIREPYKNYEEIGELFNTKELAENYVNELKISYLFSSISLYIHEYKCTNKTLPGYTDYIGTHKQFYQNLIDKYHLKFAQHNDKYEYELNDDTIDQILEDYLIAERSVKPGFRNPLGGYRFNIVEKHINYS